MNVVIEHGNIDTEVLKRCSSLLGFSGMGLLSYMDSIDTIRYEDLAQVGRVTTRRLDNMLRYLDFIGIIKISASIDEFSIKINNISESDIPRLFAQASRFEEPKHYSNATVELLVKYIVKKTNNNSDSFIRNQEIFARQLLEKYDADFIYFALVTGDKYLKLGIQSLRAVYYVLPMVSKEWRKCQVIMESLEKSKIAMETIDEDQPIPETAYKRIKWHRDKDGKKNKLKELPAEDIDKIIDEELTGPTQNV